MNQKLKFYNLSKEDWSEKQYDLTIFALGFESRATHILKGINNFPKNGIALGFNYGKELSYKSNFDRFIASKVEVKEDILDSDFELIIHNELHALDGYSTKSIFIDVSCFTRFRLAAIVNQIFLYSKHMQGELAVDFAYSLAEFEKPITTRYPNTVVGPAHSAFAGWSQGGYASTAAVLGLGYEQDQAIGVVEYLQAGEVWAFSPSSPIEKYKIAVREANNLLLSEMNSGQVLDYDVCSPTSIISRLESVVRGLGDSHSVVLVPFGPKIFVLCSLLIAAMKKEVAVWRVSQGSGIKACERIASHVEVGLQIVFPSLPVAANTSDQAELPHPS
ncbi:MAG: hypothetical protein HEQ17_09895 [Limnohabitans sp.]|uniref:hypothetical protein n=1 Tax=Limnohabitans sp. TaxID=1907725 RepID=UPI0025DA00A0|nr:hypothetical protein [Limnohabitans sp.]MCO4089234.1 hypothetical protein [Limnohabitans sp.]